MNNNKLEWRCNVPQLLKEILNNNPTLALMAAPIQIFSNLLSEVATRASQLNDPKLNALMCRLALYEISDPYSREYDKEKANKIIENKGG